METGKEVNNAFYETLGERWYTAKDDPVALLRAENRVKLPWIWEKMNQHDVPTGRVLDVGCGGGFLSNGLAKFGAEVTGVDLSRESLKIAEIYDETRSVKYVEADAYDLPFADQSFDVVTSMDFLEHVEDPGRVIQEISRVLKPGGLFFFHTFNRNPLSWLVVIKLVEWLVKNTPKNMHVLRLFITPKEMETYCQRGGLEVLGVTGLRPVISSITWNMLASGTISDEMRFKLTGKTWISYLGIAKKRID